MKLGLLVYLVLGMIYHMIVTDVFLWSDPWTYIHMVLWPFFVAWWMFVIAAIIVLCYGFYIGWTERDQWTGREP